MKILFVCHGNVGRSQMAEAFYNSLTKSNKAISAGTDPTTPKRYTHPSLEIIEVMKEKNIDISQKIVKFITKEMINKADKIYIMCKKEECPEFLMNSHKITFLHIEDPFNMSVEDSRRIRDEIKEKVHQLIENEK